MAKQEWGKMWTGPTAVTAQSLTLQFSVLAKFYLAFVILFKSISTTK